MVSKAILSIIVIDTRGSMVPTAMETISRILKYEEVVRYIMRLDLYPNIQLAWITDLRLSVLFAELRTIKNIHPPEYPWTAKLLIMAIKLRGMQERLSE
jgi:hypothetical protein